MNHDIEDKNDENKSKFNQLSKPNLTKNELSQPDLQTQKLNEQPNESET